MIGVGWQTGNWERIKEMSQETRDPGVRVELRKLIGRILPVKPGET